MESPWEDHLLERKVESDLKDLPKTLVAFANSVMPGHTATILIGEKDDGTAVGVTNPESIQTRVRKECDRIYPAIVYRSRVYEKDGAQCVRVEIEHSGNTPHFGGPAWVRRGSTTVLASDEIFQTLVDTRLSKVSELMKWLDKDVTVAPNLASVPAPHHGPGLSVLVFNHPWPSPVTAQIVFINKFWVTLETGRKRKSEPLDKLMLAFDDDNNRLKIIVDY